VDGRSAAAVERRFIPLFMSTILLVVQDFATIHGIETYGFYNPLLQEKCKYRMIISYVFLWWDI